MPGWGLGGYGLTGWGVPGGAGQLQLLSAAPQRENVVRLQFSKPVYFSRLLDPPDASSRKRYVIVPVSGTADDDGDPTRSVFPAVAALVQEAGAGGTQIDVTVDRPFSSWPAKYSIAVNQLRAVDGSLLDIARTSATFDGLQYAEAGGASRSAVASGDFANPQTAEGLTLGVTPQQAAILGSYPIGPSGDYATDRGLESYKKRIIRRLLSKRGGFAALSSTYGLGPQERVKKLFRNSEATQLAADAEAQIRLDPETSNVSVTVIPISGHPEIGYFKVLAQHISGSNLDFSVPISG